MCCVLLTPKQLMCAGKNSSVIAAHTRRSRGTGVGGDGQISTWGNMISFPPHIWVPKQVLNEPFKNTKHRFPVKMHIWSHFCPPLAPSPLILVANRFWEAIFLKNNNTCVKMATTSTILPQSSSKLIRHCMLLLLTKYNSGLSFFTQVKCV